MTLLESAMGGRSAVIENIGFSTLDQKQEHFLRLLSDPARVGDGLMTIAKDAGLSPAHVLELLRHSSQAKAVAVAMVKLAEATPGIVQDLTEKAVDAEIQCPECFGEDLGEEMCFKCKGRGKIIRYSDLDRQKLALEAIGVVKRGPGLAVQVNQSVGVMQPGNFFSKFVSASDRTAYEVGAIDADIVKKDRTDGE